MIKRLNNRHGEGRLDPLAFVFVFHDSQRWNGFLSEKIKL